MKALSFLKVATALATAGCIINSSSMWVSAATITWTNAASGIWSNTNNWSSHVVPGPGDTAIITNLGVTVTLDMSLTIGGVILGTNGPGTVTLAMNNQTLALNGPLTVNPSGSYTVDSGTLYGNTNAVLHGTIGWSAGSLGGVLTLASGGTLNITSGNNHFINSGTITNNGTVAWSSGTIQAGGSPGTLIFNYGLWDCQSDQTWNNYYGGNGTVFNNYGTFRKSVSTGGNTTFNSGAVFNQLAGKLDSQTNYIVLQGGGNFTGGYATNLVGYVYLNAGAFDINGTITSTNVQLAGGTLIGNNVIAGGLNWIIGDWNNSASETIASNSLLLVTTGNGHNVQNCTITNYGTVTWNNGSIQGGGGSPGTTVYNYGLWDCQSDQSWNNAYGGNGTVFNNYGTLRKSGSTGGNTTFANGSVFNQLAGKLDSQTNYIVLQGGGNFTGGYATNLAGYIYLNSGAFNFNGTLTSTNVQLVGATLTGNNVIRGGLNWISGDWNNSVSETITTNSLLLVTSGNGHNIQNCTITNYGTVAWNSGSIQGGGSSPGTTVYNYGLWDCQSDQNWNEPYGGNGTVFNNYGTLRKSGGASEFATATAFVNGLLFNQLAGVIDVQNGTNGLQLTFQGGGNFTGGYVTSNQFGLMVLSAGNFTVNGTVTGTNTWENGGNLVGSNVINGSLTWVNGNWNSVGSVTISPGSTVLVVGGGGANNMENATIINNGTVVWVSGTIQGGGGSPGTFIYNNGLWDCRCDQTLNGAWGGNGTVFNNVGTVRKSVGTNSSQTVIAGGVYFNQTSGTLNVQQGNFWLQGGGSFTGGTVIGVGLTYLYQGNYTINGTVTSSNVIENSANLVGTNVINGALNWQAGVWNGVNLTIASNSIVTVTGINNNDLPNSWVTNYGTVAWTSGTIRGGGGSPGTFIYNYGLWDCQSDQIFNSAFGGNNTTFNNYGIFRKDGGGPVFTNWTTMANGVLFNQLAGVIDVQNGTNGLQLSIQGGGNFTGGYITTNQFGLTVLAGGNFTVNGTITGTNTWENAGSLFGTNIIRGGLTWLAGIWNGINLTVASNSTVAIAGGVANLDLPNTWITNYGTINWSSGILRGGGGSPGTFVYNYGLWDAQSDQVFNSAYGGNNTTFNNYGMLRKSAGADTNQTLLQTGVFVNNSGTIDSQAGWLVLQGGFSLSNGTVLNFGLNSRTNYGKLNLSGAAPLTGTVSANLNNGYQPTAGSAFTNLYYSSYTNLFTSAIFPLIDAWTTNYYSTKFVLTALNARPVFAPLPTNWFIVNELTAISVTNTATDVDAGQTLSYSLVAGTNGMTVNSANGIFSWTPQQTNSPSTNIVSMAVTDNGSPPLSATNTFTVSVREVNVPPSMPTISTQTVNELTLLTVTNTATNLNIHSTIIGYTLATPPSNMVISPGGIITWTPAQTQSPGTNLITTVVTNSNPYDTVNPRLTATNTITVIVKEVNQRPALGSIVPQTLTLLQLFSIGNSATEPNIHSTTTGYGLLSPPAGASINASGLITWTPQPYQTLTTNTIITVVTNSNPYDIVNPHLTATNSFLAVVVPNLSRTNISMLNLGGTNLGLNWPSDHTGWRLQSQTNSLAVGLSTNWVTVSGSAATNQVIIFISQANGIVAFRMIYP